MTSRDEKKIVLVGGCFDILHYGHVVFLEKARALGDALVVALESDWFITTHKHRAPVHTQLIRKKMLEALRCVDTVIALPPMTGSEDYRTLVQKIKPSIIAVTSPDPQYEHKQKFAREVGGRVVSVTRRIPGHSSTSLVEALRGR